MRCAICDREDDQIRYDRKSDTFTDCMVCREIIDDCLSEFDHEETLEGFNEG